jgi:hypothetical protein
LSAPRVGAFCPQTQPWWLAADGGGIASYADCARQLSVADPSGREMMISGGRAEAGLSRCQGFCVLRQSAERGGTVLCVAAYEGSTATLAVVEMAGRVRSDSGHERELAAWAADRQPDGVSPSSYPARPDRTSPHFPGRDFARGHGRGLVGSSPAAAQSLGPASHLATVSNESGEGG